MPKTLFGFTKPIFSGNKAAITAKRLADVYIKTNTDETGVVSDPNVYREAINILLPYSDDLIVANKIAGLENSINKLNTKIEKAEKDLVLFKSKYQEGLMNTVQESYTDPMNLFESLALYYGGALEKYDENIIGGSLRELPSGMKIPQSVLTFREELNKKSKEIINLSNSYFFEDPEAKLAGPVEPDAYGVFIQTNPQTGALIGVDVSIVDSIVGVPKGFIKTDSRYGRLPIYLNTFSSGEDRKGRIGDVGYEWDSEDNVLKMEKGVLGGFMTGLERIFGSFKEEETMKGIKQEQQEIPLGSVPFDYHQIPMESVVMDTKGNYHWYGSDGYLWKAKDVDTLKKYLTEINKDSTQVDNQVFIGHPDFISSKFILDEKGNERIIDDNTLGTFKIQRQTTPVISSGKEEVEGGFKMSGVETSTTPTAVKPSPEYLSGARQYDVRKVIEKGKELFKPVTAPFENIFKK